MADAAGAEPDHAQMLQRAATENDVKLLLDARDTDTIEAAAKAISSNGTLQYLTIEFDPPGWGWKGTFYDGPLHRALQRNTTILRLTIIGSRTPKSWKSFVQRNALLRIPPQLLPRDAIEVFNEGCDLTTVSWAKPADGRFDALGPDARVDGGAEGAVYRVTIDGVEVAGKQPCFLRDPGFYGLLDARHGAAARANVRKELLKEVHALRTLHGHPNVVGFCGVFYTMLEGVAMPTWICMTYIERTLHDRIQDGEAEFTPDMLGIASALEHIHSHRMMHRDLKPKNILVAEDGTMIVADFGFTKVSHMRTSQNPALHTGGGTPAYRAPEADDRVYNTSVDVYAMGVIGVEILLKETPGGTHDLRLDQVARVVKEYPEHGRLIEHCTATVPDERPSAAAAAACLEASVKMHDRNDHNMRFAMKILNHGVGPYPPCEEAVRLLRSAADHGNPDAMCELGVCLFYGRGVHKNEPEAKAVWREAADKASVEAPGRLALEDLDYRRSVDPALIDAAVARWRERAAQSHADAQFYLGGCVRAGLGVAKDEAEAVQWYRRSAHQGCAMAQNNLGWCYHTGTGVAQDKCEAARLYRMAADQGHARAQANLGVCLEVGLGRVAKDPAEAVRLYRLSADHGDSAGLYLLGECYKNGVGVEKDLTEAKRWLTLSAEQGYQDAQSLLQSL